MIYTGKSLAVGCLAAILLGSGLHFLYDLWPNPFTALIAPVSESLWEHVKIVLWPYLLTALVLTQGRPGALRPWLLTLPILCFIMLAVGYLYHITLGRDALWFDLVLYALLMIFGFWLPTRFSGPFTGKLWMLPVVVTLVLILMTFWFTSHPPQGRLFVDFSKAAENTHPTQTTMV